MFLNHMAFWCVGSTSGKILGVVIITYLEGIKLEKLDSDSISSLFFISTFVILESVITNVLVSSYFSQGGILATLTAMLLNLLNCEEFWVDIMLWTMRWFGLSLVLCVCETSTDIYKPQFITYHDMWTDS